MSAAGLLETFVRLALLVAGLLLPGSLVLRLLRLSWTLAGAFAISAALLYALVLGFQLAGVPFTLARLAAGLAAASVLARLAPARGAPTIHSPWHACLSRLGAWTPLYAGFWAVVGWRLATQPLTGPDVVFRWNWLAQQMISAGSLDFYPPTSASDFLHYFWAESIPPGVASLYGWAYACAGNFDAHWTSPVVALQLLSLHELAWRLGNRWGGEIVARRAVLLVAATPLLSWSVLIGQETGLIALAGCGLAWTLAHLRDDHWHRWAALSVAFAVVASAAREYGVAFAGLAVVAAAMSSPPRRALVLAAGALPLAAVWPLRTWALTGNPFYSLDLGGAFAVNPVFSAWSAAFHAPHARPLSDVASWASLGRYLLLWAFPAVVGGVVLGALLLRRQRDAQIPALLTLLCVALWWWSLSYTAGGVFYSLRVLAPALALLAVLAAYGLTAWLPPPAGRLAVVAMALLLVEALPKTLVLPENPYRTPVSEWPLAGRRFMDSASAEGRALARTLQALPPSERIITDNAGYPALLGPLGFEVVPLWSPAIAWLFDSRLPPQEIARRWAASGNRYLVLSRSPSGSAFVMQRGRWRAPHFVVRPVAESGGNIVLEATANGP